MANGRPGAAASTPQGKKKAGGAPPFTPTAPKQKKGYEWEAALADYMSIPYNANVKKFFDAWATAEGNGGTNNPFNITIDYTGGSLKQRFNSSGVLNFDTPLDGIKATAAFILRRTPNIASAIRAQNFSGAASSIQAAGWAGSDPNYGAHIISIYKTGAIKLGPNVPSTLSPKAKAQVTAEQAGLTASAEAGNAAYVQAQIDKATQIAVAKQTAHLSDPWVVVKTDKQGRVIGFGQAYGAAAPKNALTYGGQPLTKSDLSSVWNSQYADIFEQFTGQVATAQDIVDTLRKGLSPYGLRTQLAQRKTFVNSPIYKAQAAGINGLAHQILGTAAPQDVVRQALAQNWDQATLEQHLRSIPAYLKGPEYQTNLAQMKTVYQQIYGAPDDNANQSIRETAANGWTPDQFASYLRSQPQYKTSIEYQSHAVNFLDAMGLLIGSRPTLTPQAQSITGGTAVDNASVVPGTPKPLNPALNFTPSLTGASGLAATP